MPLMSKIESWKTLEGRSVDGKFPLRQWLGGSDHSAVFLTASDASGAQKLAIKLIEAESAEGEQQAPPLGELTKLSHPHLIRIFAVGRTQIEAVPFHYLVMELADDDLSQILPQRALEPSEVSDLLPPLLDALSYLHGQGLVHGRVKPSNILAVGDQLKLSADQVARPAEAHAAQRRDSYDAPETDSGVLSSASDVWSLGMLLSEALAPQAKPAGETAARNIGLASSIPEPFRGIARECLQEDPKRRCSLEQIAARLQPPARTVSAPPEPPPAARDTRKRFPVFGIALAIVVVILIAFAFMHSRENNRATSPPETQPLPTGEVPVAPPSKTAAPPEAKGSTRGDVAHQVIPDVPKTAENTIHGTIKIAVEVDADASGKVTAARFRMRGSSPYFYERALKAAQQWEFSPPVINGVPAPSRWLILFRFKRNSMQASAQQLKR